MKTLIHISILLHLSVIAGRGQYFLNASFEGPPGLSVTPEGWIPYDDYSSPDTEPLACDDFPASDGKTYLTLVIRGIHNSKLNTAENAQSGLLQPMKEGSYYQLTVDLASRDDVGHFSWESGFITYSANVKMKIFGSNVAVNKGILLAETDAITNPFWDTYSLILYPQEEINYLTIEAGHADSSQASGNLQVDHMQVEEIDEPPLDFGDLFIPNVFTPNGDGINDTFIMRGLTNNSSLMVFDRSGKEVYESSNYNNDWDGTDADGDLLTEDAYWYVLITPDPLETHRGFIYLKR